MVTDLGDHDVDDDHILTMVTGALDVPKKWPMTTVIGFESFWPRLNMIMIVAEHDAKPELTKLPRLVSFVLTEENRPSRSHLNSPRTCGRGGDLDVDDDVLVDIDAGVDVDADVDFDVDVDVDFDVDADADVKRYLAHLALHDVCVLLQGLV